MTQITSSQRSDMTAADHCWSGRHSLPRPDNRRPAPLRSRHEAARFKLLPNSIKKRKPFIGDLRLLDGRAKACRSNWRTLIAGVSERRSGFGVPCTCCSMENVVTRSIDLSSADRILNRGSIPIPRMYKALFAQHKAILDIRRDVRRSRLKIRRKIAK
jgi:hypothetical protein